MKILSKISWLYLIMLVVPSCKNESPDPVILTNEQNYFLEIALGSKYQSPNQKILKWNSDINVYITDSSYKYLIDEFNKIKDELNSLNKSFIIKRTMHQDEANFIIFLSDKDTYTKHEPNALDFAQDNWGMAWVYWEEHTIYKGNMYVDMFSTSNKYALKHLLRKGITAGLGLLNQKNRYPESIFYYTWTTSTTYADIDKEILKIFFSPYILPGMSRDDIIDHFVAN